jgi:hypothetical protein
LNNDLATRQEVEDVVVRMFVATDERNWTALMSCFTDPFTLDMTSLAGGAPASMTPAQIANAWAEGFKPLDHVHHQIGNLRTVVAGETATVKCYGIALHHRAQAIGGKTRTFVGTYEMQLMVVTGHWRISHLTFNLKFIDGNAELERS